MNLTNPLHGPIIAQLVVYGAPRTKKNHGRRIKRGKRTLHVGSEALKLWNDKAVWQLRNTWRGAATIGYRVSVCAHFYRDAERGDAVGYYQALGDALQEAKVILDDALIADWDGSRLYKDAREPRIQIVIREARP